MSMGYNLKMLKVQKIILKEPVHFQQVKGVYELFHKNCKPIEFDSQLRPSFNASLQFVITAVVNTIDETESESSCD